MEALWSAVLPELRQQLGERNYGVWVEPIRCRGEGDEVRLEVPSRFFQNWIAQHFLQVIGETLERLAGRKLRVRVVVVTPSERAVASVPGRNGANGAVAHGSGANAGAETGAAKQRAPKIGRLNPKYTFKTFVVGVSNEAAYRAAQTSAAAPGRRYNPVFLYGGVGLGKTHLVNAIAHDLLRRWPRIRVACLPADEFVNELIASMRSDRMTQWRERYRKIDALILDDVQFFAGKERTQEEFLNAFNALYGDGKQIVLTSDKPPNLIVGLEERLRSRFEGGMIADIHPPTREMREAIVVAKAAEHGLEISPEIARLIVQLCGKTVRELEGALTRIAHMASLTRSPITPELVRCALGAFMRTVPEVSVEDVQSAVSKHYGVNVADIVSQRRERRLVLPRQVAMYLSRTVAEASYPSIAEKFGGRDHSTIMHAVKVIEGKRYVDASLARSISAIETQLRAGA